MVLGRRQVAAPLELEIGVGIVQVYRHKGKCARGSQEPGRQLRKYADGSIRERAVRAGWGEETYASVRPAAVAEGASHHEASGGRFSAGPSPGHADVDLGEAEAVVEAGDRPPQFLAVHGLLER